MYGISILSRTSTASRIITRELLRLQGKKKVTKSYLIFVVLLEKNAHCIKKYIIILQVILGLGYSIFKIVYFFQTRSIRLYLGQFDSS